MPQADRGASCLSLKKADLSKGKELNTCGVCLSAMTNRQTQIIVAVNGCTHNSVTTDILIMLSHIHI
jgi:hypothetical protein